MAFSSTNFKKHLFILNGDIHESKWHEMENNDKFTKESHPYKPNNVQCFV